VGQIYEERGKSPPRYVQVVQIRADGSVALQRIGPALPHLLGRRTLRRRQSFEKRFEFVYEELASSICTCCGKKIMTRHYSESTKSEYCGKGGACWECFRLGKEPKK
jgi:hypothetical protein